MLSRNTLVFGRFNSKERTNIHRTPFFFTSLIPHCLKSQLPKYCGKKALLGVAKSLEVTFFVFLGVGAILKSCLTSSYTPIWLCPGLFLELLYQCMPFYIYTYASLKVNFASNNTPKHVYFTFFCSRMEKHAAFLAKRCRLCGKNLLTLKTVHNCEKTALGSELLNFICEDIELDSGEIHPTPHLLVSYGNRREQEGAVVIFVTPTITIIRSLD